MTEGEEFKRRQRHSSQEIARLVTEFGRVRLGVAKFVSLQVFQQISAVSAGPAKRWAQVADSSNWQITQPG
jgi:hypothetical protein